MFVKLHEQIFGSSIMEEEVEIRYVWICLLTLADREGFIDITIPAIARRINIEEDWVSKAINKFMQPDETSRTMAHDGRRLEPIRSSFGWKVVNYTHYRELRNEDTRREQNKLSQRRHRAGDVCQHPSASVSACQYPSAMSAHADADADADADINISTNITSAASDEKIYRLQPEENESSYVQPDVLSELPVETTQDVLSELPAKITPDVPTGLPAKTRDALIEPSLGQKRGEIKCAVKSLPQNKKIYFDYEIAKFANVTDSHVVRWKEAYPAVDVLTELRQMEVWADTNRKNRKSDWQRFIVNWFKRSQDRARPISPSWKGGEFGRFGNSKPTHVGETEKPKGKYADQVDEVIYTDA